MSAPSIDRFTSSLLWIQIGSRAHGHEGSWICLRSSSGALPEAYRHHLDTQELEQLSTAAAPARQKPPSLDTCRLPRDAGNACT